MRALWITAAALILDQLTKWWVVRSMALGESIPVLGSFFRLTYIHNPGAVFGMRLGSPTVHLLLAGVALALVCLLLWRLPPGERITSVGLALVLGGAIGNIMDRLRFGVVIDFLDFGVGGVRWWIFNLADTWVSIGTGLLIVAYGWGKKHGDSSSDSA